MRKAIAVLLCLLFFSSLSRAETEISGGFSYDNVSFKEEFGMVNVIGEMTNNSGTNYTLANFLVSVYGDDGKLIGTGYINMSNLLNGQTKTFNGLVDANYSAISKYKIQFENGF